MTINEIFTQYKLGKVDFEVYYESVKPMILGIIRANKLYKLDEDDYFQEGSIVAWECLDKFKESKNCSFATYLYNMLKWKFVKYSINSVDLVRKPQYLYDKGIDKDRTVIISSDIPVTAFGTELEVNILDLVKTEPSPEQEVIEKIELERKMSSFTPKEKRVYRLMEMGYSYEEIGRMYNQSRGSVYNKVISMKNKVRANWSRNELNLLKLNKDMPVKELAKVLDRTVKDIRDTMWRIGL